MTLGPTTPRAEPSSLLDQLAHQENELAQVVVDVLELLRPPLALTVSEWADAHRVLSAGTGPEPGPWSTARVPYLRDIMDAFSHPEVEEVTGVTPEGSRVRFKFVTHGGIQRTGSGPIVITLKSSKGKTRDLVINALTGLVKVE